MRVSVHPSLLPFAALLALCLAPAAVADPLPQGGTLLVGAAAPNVFTPLPTPVTSSGSSARSVSDDGRYVAFVSEDDGLLPDDDTAQSVYRKNRQTGELVLVSRSTTGTPSQGSCSDPSISGDGRRVAFSCTRALDPADDNDTWDVYVRDLDTSTTTLVSRSASAVSDSLSNDAEISRDGSFVAFESSATNLLPGVSGGHVYRRSLAGTTIELVDQPNVALTSNGQSWDPTISDDGTRIAFTSSATNLATPVVDANGSNDVYVRTMGGSIAPVSTIHGNATAMANNGGGSPAISGNGLYVAYASVSTNDVADDAQYGLDIRRRTLSSSAVVLVSRASGAAGAKGSGSSDAPQIDDTGQWIAFTSSSPNLDPASAAAIQVYLRHATGTYSTELVSPDAPGGAVSSQWPGMSADASTIVFSSRGQTADSEPGHQAVFARDLTTGTTSLVSRPAGSDPFKNDGAAALLAGPGALSADGRYAVYSSTAPALPGAPGNDVSEIWRRDNLTGDVVLVSRADGPGGAAADTSAYDATVSADGQRVAFRTGATNLDPAVSGGTWGVYVRDVAAGTTTLVSRLDGATGAVLSSVGPPAIAAGGTRVAFSSYDSAVGGTATSHVVVRDVAAQTTVVIGAGQDAAAESPRLDANGTRVTWTTAAADGGGKLHAGRLAPKFGTSIRHVWWADLADGVVHQLDAGTGDDADSDGATLSEDGQRAAFATAAALLGADQHAGRDVYVRDLASGEIQLASAGAAGAAADGDSSAPALSGDGRSVAFLSTATTLTADADNQADDVFVRDLAGGTTTLASRGDGATGALLDAYAGVAAISGDGGCVLFQTAARSLGTGLSPAIDRVWLRAVHGTCRAAAPVPPGSPASGGSGGGTTTTTPPGGGSTTTAKRPVITGFRARPARFARRGRKAGTKLTLHVDRAATIIIKIERLAPGHRKGGRCRPGRGTRRCTAATRVATLRKAVTKAGTVTLRFTAKVGGKPIARGRYRATATAKNTAGTSKRLRVKLRAR